MLEWVKDIAKFSDNNYGERGIQRVLNMLGFPVSCRKTAQLMKEVGVWVQYKKKYKVTINSDYKMPH
jgi:putative transposase